MFVKKLKDDEILQIMRAISDPECEIVSIFRKVTDPDQFSGYGRKICTA